MGRLTALITGASGGIGEALAERFASAGYDIIITARDEAALAAAASRIAEAHGVTATPIVSDLSARDAGQALADAVATRGLSVDVLVNNAGLGEAGNFDSTRRDRQLAMIDVNDRALVELTHIYWPGMLAKGFGGVLNVASTSAFQPGPGMAIYFASKAFVLSFSEALWEEAHGTGVKVSCLCPGPTESRFRARAGTDTPGLADGPPPMTAAEVAEAGFAGLMANRRVVVPGARNRRLIALTRWLPREMVLKAVRRTMAPKEARA